MNKEKLQVLSRNFFIKLSEKLQVKLVLSGYDNDASGIQDCEEIIAGVISIRTDLESSIEEADCRMVPHIAKTAEEGC